MRVRNIVLLITIALAVLVGCGKKADTQKKGPRTINVQVINAPTRTVRPFVEAVGALRADEEVVISAETTGVINGLFVDEGTPVPAGSTLATIDDTDMRLDAARAAAALKQARATMENLRVEYGRKERLARENLIPEQQFDDVKTSLSLAEAAVASSEAALEMAERKVVKSRIAAPMGGRVSVRKVSVGDYVREGTQLFTLIRTNPLRMRFSVSERDALLVRAGAEVTFSMDSMPGRTFTGRVVLLSPVLNESTRTRDVEAAVSNPGGALLPGMFGKLTMVTGQTRPAVLIPVSSVMTEDESTFIYVADADTARKRSVKLGARFGEEVEIAEGLKAGEQVIVVGQNNIADGSKINVAR